MAGGAPRWGLWLDIVSASEYFPEGVPSGVDTVSVSILPRRGPHWGSPVSTAMWHGWFATIPREAMRPRLSAALMAGRAAAGLSRRLGRGGGTVQVVGTNVKLVPAQLAAQSQPRPGLQLVGEPGLVEPDR